MNQEKTGAFIAECRKQKNLTQEQLGEILGVSSKSVSRWENGKTLPDYAMLDSLCDALGVSINEFFYGQRMPGQDVKNLSEEKLRLYVREKYRRRLIHKLTALGGVMGVLFFVIVWFVFLN